MEPILEVKHLKKIYAKREQKEFCAVDDVSFQIMPGEILGLVGESGSGKSTIARMITRLEDPTEGEIWLDGKNITGLKGKKLREIYSRVQMVFQMPAASFDPRRTLGDGIGESLKNRGIPKEEREKRVKELLKQCGLQEDFAGRYPHEVSGGQCQRAAIARALAAEPALIILDEATSALDVTVQRQIIELLQQLHEEKNIACLFICHNPALVQKFCDRVVDMQSLAC